MKNIRNFYLEIFPFLVVKFSIYLNRRVFVMLSKLCPHFFRLSGVKISLKSLSIKIKSKNYYIFK